MKASILILIFLISGVAVMAFRATKKPLVEFTGSFYELSYKSIEGEEIPLSTYKGKYILFVNVASKCGFTPQYEGLQNLSEQHGDQLVVIGFPCNQFLGQEPGTEAEIVEFCQARYGVTFPLSSKIDVKGKHQDPIYQWLTNKEKNGVASNKVKWNFHKFLVSPEGEWLGSWGSSTKPLDDEIMQALSAEN